MAVSLTLLAALRRRGHGGVFPGHHAACPRAVTGVCGVSRQGAERLPLHPTLEQSGRPFYMRNMQGENERRGRAENKSGLGALLDCTAC